MGGGRGRRARVPEAGTASEVREELKKRLYRRTFILAAWLYLGPDDGEPTASQTGVNGSCRTTIPPSYDFNNGTP